MLRRVRKSPNLPEKYKQEFLKRDPNIFIDQNSRSVYETFIKLLEYFDNYNQWPSIINNPVNEEEIIANELHDAIGRIKFNLNSKMLNDHRDLVLEILKRDIHFFENSLELSVKQKLEMVKNLYIKNGHWPSYIEDKKLNSFMSNILTGKIALTEIQINELKLLDDTLDVSNVKKRSLFINISMTSPNGKEKIKKYEIIREE